ncbi:hypothetical protein LTS08_001501 [Lithohypha guttulata]|uniref:uncharacterized protein n=1 Tax=Lithohypha guttulata TaxID=1690604 RepID=UPI002DE096B2|nr:hypothetical protein LTR51_003833 [Lithohypha guttulata]KAK5105226.1 hypothetical protein LTS08_001501 [Lithohypha guttulata]
MASRTHPPPRREVIHSLDRNKFLFREPQNLDMSDRSVQEPAMPVSHVENVRQNVTANVPPAEDVFILSAIDNDGRTVEDLTVTSRRLARYEELLGEIFTLVSPEVRSMINEARQQVGANGSSASGLKLML